MDKIEIWHGTNNKFAVIFTRNDFSNEKIIKICSKFKTEGLMLLNIVNKNTISMSFYNPDGTKDNCGNGLRVAAFYCYSKKHVGLQGKILSLNREFKYKIEQNTVYVTFNSVSKCDGLWNIGGVLHKVIIVKSFERWKRKTQSLRKKYNANITLVRNCGKDIFARTFEMGVENFTASCGTGSIAASLETGKSQIFMPGGVLTVNNYEGVISLGGIVGRLR